VQSWLGSGPNMGITSDQLRAALGSDQLGQLARHFGIDPDATLKLLAEHLPSIDDQARNAQMVEKAAPIRATISLLTAQKSDVNVIYIYTWEASPWSSFRNSTNSESPPGSL